MGALFCRKTVSGDGAKNWCKDLRNRRRALEGVKAFLRHRTALGTDEILLDQFLRLSTELSDPPEHITSADILDALALMVGASLPAGAARRSKEEYSQSSIIGCSREHPIMLDWEFSCIVCLIWVPSPYALQGGQSHT